MQYLAGNAVALLENGEQYFPALEASIDAAAREIFLQSYIFDDDRTGRRIAAALERAAARGVAVRAMVDGFGGRNFVAGLLPRLREAGVQVLIYRRELRPLSLRRHRLRRLHRKVVVIDGRVAFVGGINVVDDFDAGVLAHPRYDYAVRVEGPLLEPIVASAQRLWRLVAWASLRRRDLQPLLAPPHVQPAGEIRAAFVVRDNLRYRHAIENAYLEAIGGARDEIVIANAYFFPGRRFRQALVDAAERGVRVTLLLQGLSEDVLEEIGASLRLTEGAEVLFAELKRLGYKTAILSGGFTYFAKQLQAKLGIDYVFANELQVVEG